MKEYISIGKNVDIAISDGLIALGLTREDVDIKILETGGLFKKAKVCLMYEEKIEEVKAEPVVQPVEPVVEIEKVAEPVTEEQPEVQPIVTEDAPIEQVEVKVDTELVEEKPSKPVVGPEGLIERVRTFLQQLASKMKINATVECVINDNDLNFNVSGDNIGKMIGYRGETMSAIQTLLGSLKQAGEGRYRVYIDIANYKKEREQTIVDLANRMADKAEEIERNVHLDPMSAYERRIVHSALQGRELVETESMGEGEKRHVVIKFKR